MLNVENHTGNGIHFDQLDVSTAGMKDGTMGIEIYTLGDGPSIDLVVSPAQALALIAELSRAVALAVAP